MKTIKRTLALVIVFCLMISFVPVALAADDLTSADFDFAANTNLTYDGTAKTAATAALKAGITGAGTVTISYVGTGSTTYTKSATAPSAVGSYNVVADVTAGTNYNAATDLVIGSFAITAATLTSADFDFTPNANLTYDGNPKPYATAAIKGSVVGAGTATFSYVGIGGTTYTKSATAPSAVGSYNVVADVTAGTNYTAATDLVIGTFTIASTTLAATDFDFAANTNLTYDSTPKTAATAALKSSIIGAGTVTISYVGTGTTVYAKSTTAPSAVGSYNVVADVAVGTNYAAASDILIGSFTITAATLAAPTGVTLNANGTVSWTHSANATGYSIQLYKNGSSSGSAVVVGATNTGSVTLTAPGTYYVNVTATDGTNYNNSTVAQSNTVKLGSFIPRSSTTSGDISGTTYSLGSVGTGYTASSWAHTFNIYNDGADTVSGITISSSSTNFTVGTTSISSLASGSSTNFTVTPKSGLSANTYTTTITATATINGTAVTKTFYVSFIVTGSSAISIRTTASSSSSDIIGDTVALSTASTTSYTPSSYGKTFYVYNTGSNSLTGVSVSLSSTRYFEVYSSPSTSISSSSSSSFVIRPVSGLSKGSYSVTVTVSANNATSRSFTLTFKVGGTSNTTDYFVVNTSESSAKTSSSIDAYEFSDAAVGYAQPDPETFWIHNVYGSTIKGISVKLTGDNKSSFTLSTKNTDSSLSKGEETSFTLVPNEGLKKGTYECTITISSTTSDVEDYVIDVTFEVGTASLYFSTKKSGTAISSLEFDNAVEGYSISGTQTIYVNNDSGSQLKGVEVALSGTDKSSFKLTGGSLGTIKDGDYESFEIAPIAGLSAGTYTAKLTVSNTTNNKTATMTLSFKVTASSTSPIDTTPTPSASFVDTSSHWANSYIESLYAQGYVNGIGNNQFAPNNTLTRAQFVQFLYNGFGSNAIASACPFDDVEQNAWYKNAVNWAYANGLVTGYSSTEFGPNYSITREQMATIMGRLVEQYGISLPSTNARAAFADDSDIAAYAKDYVYKMQMADIIAGKTGNVFDPKGNTTRGEMAKVMYYVLYYAGKIGTAYRVA